MENKTIISPERAAYEIPEIWESNWFSLEDETRVKEFSKKIPNDVMSLLDVGCGNGLFLHYITENISKKGLRICGVDRSKAALAHVKTEKYIASVDELPFSDREFDIVISLEVIEHLPVNVYEKSLKEITRIAGRYILVGVPFDQDLRKSLIECPICACRFNADYHLRSFSETTIKNLFNDNNFECRELFYIHEHKVMPNWFYHTYVFLKALTRICSKAGQKIYPGYAVCPACGYHDRSRLLNELKLRKKNTPKFEDNNAISALKNIVMLFFFKKKYRWIGAIYERIE